MWKAVLCLIFTASLLIWFQNCGEQYNSDPDELLQGVQNKSVVAVDTASYVQIKYKMSPSQSQSGEIKIDLESSQLTIMAEDETQKSCDIPDELNQQIASYVTKVQICEPAPLGPDQVTCMAIGAPDIELISLESRSEWLQPTICNTGRYLCNGSDAELRQILADLNCE